MPGPFAHSFLCCRLCTPGQTGQPAPQAEVAAQHLICEQRQVCPGPSLDRLLPKLPPSLVAGLEQVRAAPAQMQGRSMHLQLRGGRAQPWPRQGVHAASAKKSGLCSADRAFKEASVGGSIPQS